MSIILFVLALLFTLSLLFYVVKRIVQKKLANIIATQFDEKAILGVSTQVNFLGQHSKRLTQIRGNGALILTQEQLTFILAFPQREYTIPLHQITKVTTRKSFLLKSYFTQLLVIHFFHDEIEDSIAFEIKNRQQWHEAIDALVQKNMHYGENACS